VLIAVYLTQSGAIIRSWETPWP